MHKTLRRRFLGIMLGALGVPILGMNTIPDARAQNSEPSYPEIEEQKAPAKPEVRRSIIKDEIQEDIERVARAKEALGLDMSATDKEQFVKEVVQSLETQDLYVFIDP